ncbi:MAG: PD-(D/E)XK nuclease family protein [Bacteroidales bacterium]|nr:PD-(D/E)XK nuclease family protein [Bacteroidales bacterium]
MEENIHNQEFKIISKLPIRKTWKWSFLEEIGVSHKETIIAKLLGYYFNPNNRHGLGDIFLKSLLQTERYSLELKEKSKLQKIEIQETYDWANVIIEETTNNNNRIDILIETEKQIIAIEFKINHVLDNPLSDYEDHINNKYTDKERVFLVLLPVWKKAEGKATAGNSFKQVLLSRFIENVEKNRKLQKKEFSDKEQEVYYHDFINTIENRKITYEMIEQYKNFTQAESDNLQKLENIFSNLNLIQEKLDKENKSLSKAIVSSKFEILVQSINKIESVIKTRFAKNRELKVRNTLKGVTVELWIKQSEKWQIENIIYENKEFSISDLKQVINEFLTNK